MGESEPHGPFNEVSADGEGHRDAVNVSEHWPVRSAGSRRDRVAHVAEYAGRGALAGMLIAIGGVWLALRFAAYCVLRVVRPVFMLAANIVCGGCVLTAAIMYFLAGQPWTRALAVFGVGIACFALRELYDWILGWAAGAGAEPR